MVQTETRYDVSFGDVRDAQIVIGDHTTVVTPDGVKVVRLVGDARPKLRPSAAGTRPAQVRPLVGRQTELELARRAAPGWPLQLYGREGSGKTSLLKHAAVDAPPGPVVYAVARRRSLDDLQGMLFRSFWEAEERFVPAPDQVPAYLADREAIVVLDDVPLDRDDLAVLLDTAPRCTFVLASPARTLWGSGATHELRGLGPAESVQLIERELGRPLAAPEHAAAVTLAAECRGHPQSLVELAALVLDRRASLEQLAATRGASAAPTAGDSLTAAQTRVLGVLATLPDSALGTAHVASLAATGNANALLDQLERSGWVKSQSPRYRLARQVPAQAHPLPLAAVVQQLADWARSGGTTPDAVAEDSEAVEAALERALHDGRNDLALDLARSTEAKLAMSGLLGSWRRVLGAGLSAARAAGAPRVADEAYMLHQLGSGAICARGDSAREYLLAALDIRERIGDERGAELTRHNLAQIGGGGPPDGNGNGHRNGGPRRPRMGPLLGGLGFAAAVGVAVALLAHSGGPARVAAVVPTPVAGHRPNVAIASPAANVSLPEGSDIRAVYGCKAAPEARPVKCTGELRGRGPVPSGSSLPSSRGSYVLVVTARDQRGRTRRRVIGYTVVGGEKGTGAPVTDTTPTATETTPIPSGTTETTPTETTTTTVPAPAAPAPAPAAPAAPAPSLPSRGPDGPIVR